MFVPDFEIACTCTPVERPCVMSKLLVTIWNSAIASRLKRGSPEPELSTFCLICWPSRFRLNDSFWPMPGEFVTLFAVTPLRAALVIAFAELAAGDGVEVTTHITVRRTASR